MFDNAEILAFHQTSRKYYPGINNIRPDKMLGLINLLKILNLSFWSAEKPVSMQSENKQVVLSFDDGYKDNIYILRQLCDEGITPIVFVPTAYIGKTNSWDYSSSLFPAEHLDEADIKALSDGGVLFGSHGVSHHALTSMNIDSIKSELGVSRKTLEDITGRVVTLLSYPFGRSSAVIDRMAQEAGYRHGMVLNKEQVIQINGPSGEPNNFCFARTAIYSIDNYYSIKAKIRGGSKREQFKNRIINNLAGGTIFSSPSLK